MSVTGIRLNAALGHDHHLVIEVVPWTAECQNIQKETYHSVGRQIAREMWQHIPAEVTDSMLLILLELELEISHEDQQEKRDALILLRNLYRERMGE